MTRSMYDAAYAPPAPHLDVCAFYIGFPGSTPHIWSDAEVSAQSARWRLPIATRVNAQGSAQADADADTAVSWMQAHGVPRGCAVALDFEAQVNGAYITAFDKRVVSRGYTVLLYGQESTVYQNPRPSAGYWSGQWTQTPHLDSRDSATQWASDQQLGKPYDLSQVSDSLVLWDTQAPADPPPSQAPYDWRTDMHLDFPPSGSVARVFTPPAAVLGGDCHMVISTDFGDATMRVATFSFSTGQWTVNTYTVTRAGGALSLPLTSDVNKVSVGYESGTGTVGVDVY